MGLFFVVVILTKPLLRVASASFAISTMAGEFTEKIMCLWMPAPGESGGLDEEEGLPSLDLVWTWTAERPESPLRSAYLLRGYPIIALLSHGTVDLESLTSPPILQRISQFLDEKFRQPESIDGLMQCLCCSAGSKAPLL